VIEVIELSDEQVQAMRSQGTEMALTGEHLDLIRRSGPESGYHAMFVGDRLARIPAVEFEEMLKTAFRSGWISAMRELGIADESLISKFDMTDPQIGDTHFKVTLTLNDGRVGSGLGEIVLPSATKH
jgi:hypothetical protein